MARTSDHNVRSFGRSDDARDKLAAALNYAVRSGNAYDKTPGYFDQCERWFQDLTPDERETVLTIADAMASSHGRKVALIFAADLPPAPRCPV